MIYRLRYCNKDGVEARVDIQKGLATPIIEIEGTERPFILSYNNDKGNKSGMFLSSSADIEIYETPDFNINNLKTSNETELSVTHYINNVVSWQGFIIPDFFSIEVRNNPVITMTASDRLGTLKNVTLSDLPSMISLRELAVLCLNKTGLELPLSTMADFNNGTGVNDFFNSKILTQRLSDTKGRSISCYDILSSILTASNSFLVQRSGGWHIINKIQHEAGSGKLYTGATSFINWSDVIFNFSDISTGGRRTIIPVASTVGVFHEFGGGRMHPENYDFSLDLTGWNPVGGFVATIDNRKVDTFTTGGSGGAIISPIYGDATEKKYLVNNNEYVRNVNPIYLESDPIPIFYKGPGAVNISLDINAVGPSASSAYIRVAIIATNGTNTKTLDYSGNFIDYPDVNPPVFTAQFNDELAIAPTILKALSKGLAVSGKLEVEDDLSLYSLKIRLYGGGGGRYVLINSASVIVKSGANDNAKGIIYKVEREDNYTKAHDIDTSLFADYLTTGLNGYFYDYSIDDTSSLYNSANELTSKWTAYNDPEQLPLLQHITRQRSRLFSVAHDLLSAEIEVNNFDPLAIFVACEKRYTVVSAQFDFFKSNLSVELEEVAFQSASVRDFIYSYFGDGESGIKSIGGVSGGSGGGGTGGGLTPEQLEILSWWKKDPDRENTIFTEMNAYSKLELSAYGVDDGGGGGGSDYERLDTWASYDSSKAGWVLSAFLGNDLNTRVTDIDGRVTDLENGAGSVTSVGISVPTGLTVSNSPITSSGVIAIGLQTGYSIPTTVKQGQWDTAYGWGNHSAQNYFKSTYLRALHTQSYDANNGDNPGGFIGSYYSPGWLTNGAFTGFGGLITWRGSSGPGLKLQMQYDVGHLNPTGGRLAFRTSNSNTDNDSYTTWKVLWHSGDFTSTDVTNWNTAFNNSHTHANKTQLDLITQSNIDVLAKLSIVNGNLQIDGNAYATGELSAYGAGSGGGGGGIIETVYGYGNLGQTFNNANLTDTFNAYTINQINTRLVSVESGSATTVNTTGTGNAITSISKSGSAITANKDLTFSLAGHSHPISDITNLQTTLNNKLETSIFNTHNNDNVRHITGAERTKWDTVVTDFGNLEIGGRNLLKKTSDAWINFTGATHYVQLTFSVNLQTEIEYTVKFIVRRNTGHTAGRLTIGYRGNGWTNNDFIDNTQPISIGDNLYEYKRTFVVPATETREITTLSLRLERTNSSLPKDFDYKEIKLEKSTIPTDWTPAFEDQVSDWNTTDVNSFSYIKNKPTLLSQFTDNIGVATHIANTSNPHSVTKAQVGLGNVDNTADSVKNVLSATKLTTARTIAGVSFDGTANIAIPFANLSSKPTTLAGYGITNAYTKTEVDTALALKLNKSVFDDLFEKVEVSTGVYAIKAKYSFYSIGEVSAYGLGSGGSGGGSYDRLDAWADYDSTKSGWVLSALLGVDLNTRVTNLEGGSALTVNTTGTGNAITSLTKSGTVITATKGATFSLDNHLHTGVYEPVFTKNSAFNKNFGTTAGTVAQGNDSRIINGQTAFGWGNFRNFGLGKQVDCIEDYNSLNNVQTGFFGRGTLTAINSPTSSQYQSVINIGVGGVVQAQIANDPFKDKFFFRSKYSSWKSWNEVYHTGNLTSLSQLTDNIGVASHIANKSNPHSVTTAQIGAVDLTSNQNIGGVKSFTDNVIVKNGKYYRSENSLNQEINIFGILPGDILHIGSVGWSGLRLDLSGKANRLNINSNGDIGINNINPTEKLDVVGNIKASGTVTAPTFIGALTGNASTATKLQTARTIAGVSFDGTANIAIPFANLSSKPTTLGGYGITDAVTLNTAQTISGEKTFSDTVTAPTFSGALSGNASSATKLQTPRTIWGQSFDGTGNVSGALSGATTIAASISVASPKIIFSAAGWSMEQVGSELQMKHNDVLKMRFTSTGSIVATEEITAFG